MDNTVIQETPWSLSLQHKTVAATVKASHSPMPPASEAFLKDLYMDKKRKKEMKYAENILVSIMERFNTCSSQSELDSAYTDLEDAVKKP